MIKPGIIFLPHGNLQYSQLPPGKRPWVARESYKTIFDISEKLYFKLAFESSGETLEILARETPEVLDELIGGIKEGRIEPVASPHTHIMIPNVRKELALYQLKKGLDTWERLTGFRPITGWNPECGWCWYVPEIYREAGFEILIADADSYFLSNIPGLREKIGLKYDVYGHSNKSVLFKIEKEIENMPDMLNRFFRPNKLKNGLHIIFRSDILCNILLWYLMGATEENRERPVQLDEVGDVLLRWRSRIVDGNGFLMPYAEDAEYIGTTAYFYVKQFGLARFFEPAPESIIRFKEILSIAKDLNFNPITPRDAVFIYQSVDGVGFEYIENCAAWHGGYTVAWANTVYSRILDPLCNAILDGLEVIGKYLGITDIYNENDFQNALYFLGNAYVTDARWPPAPTSPGRFNVEEALLALEQANECVYEIMQKHGLKNLKSIYSPVLMKTRISAARIELMSMKYFGEKEPNG